MEMVLVLNSTFEPLRIATWRRAVELIFAGKAESVHSRDRALRSASGFSMPLPSVIRMLYFIKRRPRRVPLTKRNVLLRDDYRCAYCGVRGDRETMTVDHVVPRSRGGGSTWKNLVAACAPCNGRKGDRTLHAAGMTLRRKPREPAFIPFLIVARHTADDEWAKYLTLWSVSIEERVG